ncbi:Hypothetical predicted protein, partial [Paramuricea clavata]
MSFLGTKQQDRCKEITPQGSWKFKEKPDMVSDVLSDHFINIAEEVRDKEELRKNKADLSKHSSIHSIINHSNNVEDIGFHHLDAVNAEK